MGKSIDLGFKTPTDPDPFDQPFEIYSPRRSTRSTATSSTPKAGTKAASNQRLRSSKKVRKK